MVSLLSSIVVDNVRNSYRVSIVDIERSLEFLLK